MNLDSAFEQISKKTYSIAVVGDLILDRYLWGDVHRVSPEAPVPVLDFKQESTRLGGAANVAANVRSLGSKVSLFGVTGSQNCEYDQSVLFGLLKNEAVDTSGVVQDESRPVTTKTRVIAHHQQIVRIDRESREFISKYCANQILQALEAVLKTIDIIIVSDYSKGVVTPYLMEKLRELAGNKVRIILDPKQRSFSLYRDVFLVSPNVSEAVIGAGMSISTNEELLQAGEVIQKEYNIENVLITRGEHGMSLFSAKNPVHIPTRARHVFDVTGAGDTVVATLGIGLAAGLPVETSAHLANYAAGVAVGKVGTASVTLKELKDALPK